jgi:hypothetical protein
MFGKPLTIPTAVLAAMALLACKGGGEEAATSATTTGPIGVAECDEYVTKYEKCVTSKAPAASRAELKNNVEAMQSSWKTAAANPAAARGLAQGCKQALATAKTAMASYGCDW